MREVSDVEVAGIPAPSSARPSAMTTRLRSLCRRSGPNLLLALLSTAAAVAGAEWVLRTYLPSSGFIYRLHPRYLYTLAPHTRALFVHGAQNGGGLILITVNADGFRGDELRAGDHPRIVVYGDSCIEADYTRLAETLPRRLERRLSESSGMQVEVVNAGVNGYGPDQALRRLQDELPTLQPNGIVFTIFADNDFGDLIRNRLYRLEGERAVEAGGMLVDAARAMFSPSGREPGFELWERISRQVRRSRRRHRATPEMREERARVALAKYIPASLELCRLEHETVVLKRDSLIANLVTDHYDADVSLIPDSPAARYKRALLEAVLREVRATAEAHGVPILVLVVPSPIDVCDPYDIAVDPGEYPSYDRRRLSAEAARAAGRAGLAVIDLFDPFREAGAGRLYFRHGEDHWNPAGQDLAARLVSERIMADRWLHPSRHRPPGR